MNNNRGFTLLEMLLALSVLSVGIMAAFTLALANLNTANDNYQRIRAANLAREGIEIVRNIRDTNWLKIEANEDCDDGTAGIQICDWDEDLWDRTNEYATSTVAYNVSTPSFTTEDIATCFADNSCRLYANGAYDLYDHNSAGAATNMARLINVKPLCLYTDNQPIIATQFDCGDIPVGDPRRIGLLVTATVYWQDGNQTHQIEITEELYNWRSYIDA